MALVIRTARRSARADGEVIVAPPRWSDRHAFVAATRASRALHRPWVRPPTTEIAFRKWLDILRDPRHEPLLVWDVCDGGLVGYVGLSEIVLGGRRSAFVGYWATAAYAGRGVFRRGFALGLRHAFRGLRLHRVEACIQPENASSIALAARFGFRYEGLSPRYLKIDGAWRDHGRWALTREEWDATSTNAD